MQTRGRWNRQNHTFRDEVYSPAEGVSLWETCPQLAALDPAVAYTYMEDFFQYTAADWTVTEIGAGGTEAILDAAGGILVLTSDALDDDGVQIQKIGESFIPAAGKPLWFECRFKQFTAAKTIQSDILVGLCITNATLLAGLTDGLYFLKSDGSADFGAVSEKANAPTTTAAVKTIVANTWTKVGFFCDGVSNCYFYVDGVLVATHIGTTIPVVELTPSFAVLNGEAGATAYHIDYFKAVQIR